MSLPFLLPVYRISHFSIYLPLSRNIYRKPMAHSIQQQPFPPFLPLFCFSCTERTMPPLHYSLSTGSLAFHPVLIDPFSFTGKKRAGHLLVNVRPINPTVPLSSCRRVHIHIRLTDIFECPFCQIHIKPVCQYLVALWLNHHTQDIPSVPAVYYVQMIPPDLTGKQFPNILFCNFNVCCFSHYDILLSK